jgi:predicted metal-binding membrane protein
MTPAARERARVRAPLLIVSAAAWAILAATSLAAESGAAHAHHATPRLPSLAIDWLLMVAAMMGPLLTGPVRHIRDRSLARQRARSVTLFAAGYAAVWMAAGAVLEAIALGALAVESPLPIVICVCAAAVWQCSPIKQQCVNRGHVHPELAPGGRAADAAAQRFGVTHGLWCAGSCWALMLLPLVATHAHAAVMVIVSLWIAAERLERPMPRAWRVRAPQKALRLVYARSMIGEWIGRRSGQREAVCADGVQCCQVDLGTARPLSGFCDPQLSDRLLGPDSQSSA